MLKQFFILVCLCISIQTFGQKILSGIVSDEMNIGIPNASIFVKNNAELRTQSDINGYFSLPLFQGEYYLVITAVGYDDREAYITIQNSDVVRNIQLFPTKISDIDGVEIAVKKSNPGREIMLNVVKKREEINQWNTPHSVKVYIKASEQIENRQKEKSKKNDKPEEDPFEEEQRKLKQLAGNMNLAEIQLTREFSPPNKVKESREAFTLRGEDQNLYYTTTVKANFNFFENLLRLDDLHASPITSPISGPGILSYKYRLEAQYEEDGYRIDKIKIIPRYSSTSTLSGYIYVIDSLWLIQKIDLTMEKGNLLIYDYFQIQQTYSHPGDTTNVLTEQVFTYGVKYKDQVSKCKTIAQFKDYNFNPNFDSKHFNSELAVTEKEAYERDSLYWNANRIVALTPEEQRYIVVRDSIHDVLNKKEYLDSVDRVFNKITVWKVLWFGVDHRNRVQKTQWSFNSIAAMARPLYPAGPRIAPGFSYFKKWEDQRTLDCYTELSVGVLNGDIKGQTWWKYRYSPFHLGTFTTNFSHEFDAIVPFDAITQVYKRSNFIGITRLKGENDYELINGLYLNTGLEFVERRSLSDYNQVSLFDSIIPNDQFKAFESYQALIGEITLSYVPFQKYMREPYRKVILGSKWPTIYAYYQRGIPKLFGSDVNHEYAALGIMQSFQLGTIGTSNYHIRTGQFLSSKRLFDADFNYQRRSTPLWFSNPLYSFQNQDSSLPSKQWYVEAHFVHHDNGAILNKIPFMKKTGIGLVFGTSILYVNEYNYLYYEAFAGLERNFKFSKRRLRIGIYGVASDGNQIGPKYTYKISFAVLDDRNMKWNF